MSQVLPRLDRGAALDTLTHLRNRALTEVSAAMPELSERVTYSPVGGQRIETTQIQEIRQDLLGIAREHGMPDPIQNTSVWESKSARLLHSRLSITPHEASNEDVWSYLTCCWLLDIALWRFPDHTGTERFIGHLNRNTFRRMWWRAEVLGPDVDMTLLGEDEIVNIMERPSLWADRRLAQAIATEFCGRVVGGHVDDRMRLMREATKRLLRLTPFIGFEGLTDELISLVVSDAFDAATAGLTGTQLAMPQRSIPSVHVSSTQVRSLARLDLAGPPANPSDAGTEDGNVLSFDEVADAALGIARRTGRVTNNSLREIVPVITSEEARDVFRVLMDRGELVRRGVKRGTHYVLPDEVTNTRDAVSPGPETSSSGRASVPDSTSTEDGTAKPTPSSLTPSLPARSSPPPSHTNQVSPKTPTTRQPDTALRRLIKRMR